MDYIQDPLKNPILPASYTSFQAGLQPLAQYKSCHATPH